jgi:hypothetical protein
MPIAAGVVGDALVVTVIAGLNMAAQSDSAAGSDRPQDAQFFWCQFTKPMSMTLNDLCQFQRLARALDGRHGIVGCGCG